MCMEPPLFIEIVNFWREAGPKLWFKRDETFDGEIRARFETAHLMASRGEYADWDETAEGALALILLLDQFPRNIYRGSAHAFATDGLARAAARQALHAMQDETVDSPLRVFFYLPFEHSEDLADQDLAVALISAVGAEDYTRFARLHRDIIKRFGRFPHRNAALGRVSTAEEIAFLAEGGFAG